jgi:HlyD family secretion protein
MKRHTAYLLAAGIILGIFAGVLLSRGGKATETQPARVARLALPATGGWVAGPGIVEPVSESIKVGSEITGKLQSVFVDEGDTVKKGQVLAVLVNDDYHAAVLSAQATLADRKANLDKIINGARRQERDEAQAAVRETETNANNAAAEMARRHRLYEKGVVSREETENFENQCKMAKARYEESLQHFKLIDAEARTEDVEMARAAVQLAQADLEQSQAKFQKTLVRSPLDSVILRRHHRTGEIVVSSANNPDPVFTLGDCHILRVRVDVDESDVAQLRVGQRAYVTARTFGDRKFWGRVVQVGEQLGKKNVETDEPTEHIDKKILETLVQLDEGHELPVGLRVDGYIETPQ